MEKVLKLYKDIDGVQVAFPNSNDQIQTSDFTYSAQRMGGAPTISCTIMWGECLDNMWEGVYCEFNGERYHIVKTPSSSKENTDARYKHNVQFVSDRIRLESVFFYNKVEENKNPLNTSTEFSFWGDVHALAERLNKSLESSALKYRVVIDSGVTSEEKLFKAENMFVSAALQEINKTYGLMYYFVGTEIHIGEQQSFVNGIDLQYGFDKQLLSINKNNKNNKVVTRITGHGSDENIPYYYPNPTEKGTIEVVGDGQYMAGRVEVVNYHKFASSVNYGETVRLQQTEKYVGSTKISAKYYKDGNYYSTDPLSGQFRPYKYSEEGTKDGKILARISYNLYYTIHYADEGNAEITLLLPYKKSLIGTFSVDKISVKKAALTGTVPTSEIEWVDVASTPSLSDKDNYTKLSILIGEVNSTEYFPLHVIFDLCVETKKGNASLSDLKNYELYCYLEERISDRYVWKGEKKQSSNIEDFGLRLWDSSHFENNKPSYVGSGFFLRQVDYLQPSKYLMPSVYRNENGNERFYNATNGKYEDENNKPIEFANEFDENNPSEHVENFEDIKPTIQGVKNSFNEPIDIFAEFAYDLNDNDETDEDGKSIHPYFFGKLRALDFNLFDQAIDSGEMTISMTSGHCASCEFTIGVDDNRQMNLVQVDEDGNLVFDENGNVICGRKVFVDGEWVGQSATPQDRQNDTTLNEVWVALKKDTNTFGYIYPNKNVKPSEGDNFVILHIDLPQIYITNAEAKLDAALIEFMRKNNAEEFDYSVKFSRIFWEENPTALASFNENSRVNVLYNSESAQMFVSSFTYKCSSNEALPEISVSLSKELNIGTNTIQSVVNELKDFEGTVSILEQQARAKAAPAIRKDIDDDAYGAVTFHQKPTFKEGIQSDKAIKVGIGASEGFADGTGTYIDERKIQVRDLEVRGSLKVTDLVASQIHSLDGEYYFSDTMKIDRVLPTSTTTCRLYFEKEYRNDFLKFVDNDLLLSVVADINDDSTIVETDDAGNKMRNIATQSFMQILATSGDTADLLWADVSILDDTSMPTDGAYVARRGNADIESGRTSSWSLSVIDGRIVYYVDQTHTDYDKNFRDNNYALVVGRLPNIAPVKNAGAEGEIGVYAKYLLAQHITTVKWMGETQYITLDKGTWDKDEAQKGEYFYKEELMDDKTIITRTKVEHRQCVWVSKGNDTNREGVGYLIQEPSMVAPDGWDEEENGKWVQKWDILSGGAIITETSIQYTTTRTKTNPSVGFDTDGMAIGGDEVKWENDQKECAYNALFPYMWKKTTTKTMANPKGDVVIELIGVYGETGFEAHVEVPHGLVIQVPCNTSLNAREYSSYQRDIVFVIGRETYTTGLQIERLDGFNGVSHTIKGSSIVFEISSGTPIGKSLEAIFKVSMLEKDPAGGEDIEYTRNATFTFVPNVAEKSLSVQVAPTTAYIPVSEGKITESGFARIYATVLEGAETTTANIAWAEPTYYGGSEGYLNVTYASNTISIAYIAEKELAESAYAVVHASLDNGMPIAVNVLQNISGRDAIGEDAYYATVTPAAVNVPVTSDNRIIGEPHLVFNAYMYKGSSGSMGGTSITTQFSGEIVKSIEPIGSTLRMSLNSGYALYHPITIQCVVTNSDSGVARPVSITLSPSVSGVDGGMGYTGAVQRVFYDKLVSGQTYYSNSDTNEAIGVRFQDAILIECDTMESGYLAFFCTSTFTYSGKDLSFENKSASDIISTMTSTDIDNGYKRFEQVALNSSSAFFTQLIARNANVRMLSGAEIVMLDAENNVVAGVSNADIKHNGEGDKKIGYHFWSGAPDPNNASFSVNEKGILYSKGGTFDGFLQTSFKKDGDGGQLEIANPNIACERDKTYTLPSPSDDISGIHFVLIDNVGGEYATTGNNYVCVNIAGGGKFFGSEALVNGTAYTRPTRLMFRSGIIDFICYDKKWWVYNKNVEFFETDITSDIRKKERLGKQEVVFWGIVDAKLARNMIYYENEDFEIFFKGENSYDFTIRTSIPESEEYPDGAFDIVVTPRTSNNDQKNAIVHTTIRLSGEDGNSKTYYEWRITQSDVGGESKALALDVKITYTPLSI